MKIFIHAYFRIWYAIMAPEETFMMCPFMNKETQQLIALMDLQQRIKICVASITPYYIFHHFFYNENLIIRKVERLVVYE